MFEIEKGIPIPNFTPRRNKYPWRHMEVGDSFFVPTKNEAESHRIQVSLLGSVRRLKPLRFRAVLADSGVRCWRVE